MTNDQARGRRELNDPFRRRVKSRLEELEKNQAWLAGQIGLSEPSLSVMLKESTEEGKRTDSSTKVTKICEVLEIPGPEFESEYEEEWLELVRELYQISADEVYKEITRMRRVVKDRRKLLTR